MNDVMTPNDDIIGIDGGTHGSGYGIIEPQIIDYFVNLVNVRIIPHGCEPLGFDMGYNSNLSSNSSH
jgi:hypothetical protein